MNDARSGLSVVAKFCGQVKLDHFASLSDFEALNDEELKDVLRDAMQGEVDLVEHVYTVEHEDKRALVRDVS